MPNNTNRRNRVDAKPDAKLLNMLKSGDQTALQLVLNARTPEALAAIEETIALYSDNPDVAFYRLGGQRVYSEESIQAAKEELLRLAMSESLLNDPATSQGLIAGLGITPNASNEIMNKLAAYPQRLYDYQLLGVQMQLAYLLKDKISGDEVQKTNSEAENQETVEVSKERQELDETLADAINTMEQHMITLLNMLGDKAETAGKKEMTTIMDSLTQHMNDPNNSPKVRETAKNNRLRVIGIIMRRCPRLIYLADENRTSSTSRSSNINYNAGASQEKKRSNIIIFAFALGIFALVMYVRLFIVVGDYSFRFITNTILYIAPIVAAFISMKRIKAAGWVFLVYGGYKIIGSLQFITSTYLPVVLTNLLYVLCIVLGIMCLSYAKKTKQ